MKALIYKEFKLAWHPLCYVMLGLSALYNIFVNFTPIFSFVICLSIYGILFCGTNRGKQSNDLEYTVNLPIRKKDAIIARFISIAISHVIVIVLTAISAVIQKFIQPLIYPNAKNQWWSILSFRLHSLGTIIGFGLITFILYDTMWFLHFYKKGKGIIACSIVSTIIFCLVMLVFTGILPQFIFPYFIVFSNWIVQLVFVVVALGVYALTHVFIIKGATKRLKKVNF